MKFSGSTTASEGGTTVTTEVGEGRDWAIHTLRLHPEISGCTAFGQFITVSANGCELLLTANGNTQPGSFLEGTMTIACPAGKSIVITGNTTKCTVTIPAQTPKNNLIDVYNESSGATADIKIRWTVRTEPKESGKESGLTYISSGGACGESGKNGTFRGDVTTKCYSDSARTNRSAAHLSKQ